MEQKELFLNLLSNVKRNGINNLLDYLEETDFYIAPASSKYHGAYDKGLLEHSLEVYYKLLSLKNNFDFEIEEDSLKIIGLFHDICKMNFYIKTKKNSKKKDDKGNFILNPKGFPIWEEIEYYDIEDKLPLGHGEKSVIILQQFIQLNLNELMAIRWHMMAYDDVTRGYAGNLALTNALNKYPIIALTHCADLLSISLKPNKKEIELTKEDIDFINFKTNNDLVKENF